MARRRKEDPTFVDIAMQLAFAVHFYLPSTSPSASIGHQSVERDESPSHIYHRRACNEYWLSHLLRSGETKENQHSRDG